MNEMHLLKLIDEIETICLIDFRSRELQIDYSAKIRRLLSSATYRLSKVGVLSNEANFIKTIKSRSSRIDYLIDLLPKLYELERGIVAC